MVRKLCKIGLLLLHWFKYEFYLFIFRYFEGSIHMSHSWMLQLRTWKPNMWQEQPILSSIFRQLEVNAHYFANYDLSGLEKPLYRSHQLVGVWIWRQLETHTFSLNDLLVAKFSGGTTEPMKKTEWTTINSMVISNFFATSDSICNYPKFRPSRTTNFYTLSLNQH